MGALIGGWIDEISLMMATIVISIILLAVHVLSKANTLLVKLSSNVLFTILIIMAACVVMRADETQSGILIGITTVFTLGLAVAMSVLRNAKLRATFMYIPFLVVLLSIEFSFEVLAFISLFNIIVAILLTSEGSVYKNILGLLTTIIFGLALMGNVNIDIMAYVIVYISSVIVCFAQYITPKKAEELVEGGEEHE